MTEYAVVSFMVGWLLLSALCQLPGRLTRQIRSYDLAGLIPVWPFFAPIPGTSDFYLLYRDELADGVTLNWREVSLCDDRRLWHAIWNPRKREKKALFDLTTALIAEADPEHLEAIQLSVPYLAILTYISSLPRPYAPQSTQFLLMMTDSTSIGEVPEPIFTSSAHAL